MSLKYHLDTFIQTFPKEKHIDNDTVRFVHRYEDPRDREVVGLLSSAFAYGNVKSVLRKVESALGFMDSSLARTISLFNPKTDGRRLRGFYHRFNNSRD